MVLELAQTCPTLDTSSGQACVSFNSADRVQWVCGETLEINGERILESPVSPAGVREALGAPDSVGWDTVAMCEGPIAGYRYDEINTTISFSWTSSENVILTRQNEWLEFSDEEKVGSLGNYFLKRFNCPGGEKAKGE